MQKTKTRSVCDRCYDVVEREVIWRVIYRFECNVRTDRRTGGGPGTAQSERSSEKKFIDVDCLTLAS